MKTMTQQLSFAAIAEEPENTQLAEQEISVEVLIEKYAKGAELNVHDVRLRVARALAAVEQGDAVTGLQAQHLHMACSARGQVQLGAGGQGGRAMETGHLLSL